MQKHRQETQTDGELVAQARRGRSEAFDALLRRYYGVVRGIALSFAAIAEDADDLTQEAFVAAFQRLDQLTDPGRFGAWISAIVRNHGRMWLRRRLVQPALCQLEDADRIATASPRTIREAVADAMSQLSAEHRRVVQMHYLQGYDYAETASLLSVSVNSVRGKLDRARETLRKELSYMTDESRGWKLESRDMDAVRAAATVAFGREDRPAMNTILFTGQQQIVGMDMHRLFVYTSPSLQGIPGALVHADLGRALQDAAGARLRLSDSKATLGIDGGGEVTAPIVEHEYPKWDMVVPAESRVRAAARTSDWLEALALLAKQREDGFVRPELNRLVLVFSPEEGRVTMRQGQEPESPGGVSREASVSLPAQFTGGGPDLVLAINPSYLEQAVTLLGIDADSQVELGAESATTAVTTRPAGGGDTLMVTMPMQ